MQREGHHVHHASEHQSRPQPWIVTTIAHPGKQILPDRGAGCRGWVLPQADGTVVPQSQQVESQEHQV